MSRVVEIVLLAVVVGVAAWLRLAHLGTPSLWWDELVHLRMADRPFWDVLDAVRWGIPPTAGNAGAMPVDYAGRHGGRGGGRSSCSPRGPAPADVSREPGPLLRPLEDNARLHAYLEWYGLRSKVALRSPGVPMDRVEPLLLEHGGDPRVLALRPAVGLLPEMRTLLGITDDFGQVPEHVTHFGLATYTQPLSGPGTRRLVGVTVRAPAAIPPSPPRS